MNKTHRIVWSESRQTYIVAHERAAGQGKPSSTRKAVAQAVTAALLALGAAESFAVVSDCSTPGTIVVDGAGTTTCTLTNGDTLSVTGSIVVPSGSGIKVSGDTSVSGIAVAAGATVTGSTDTSTWGHGIQIGNLGGTPHTGTVSGDINNMGLIQSQYGNGAGIYLLHGTVGGSILNTGASATISGGFAGIQTESSATNSIGGGITNSGRVEGGADGMYLKSLTMTSGGIVNSGIITNSDTTSSGTGIYLLNGTTIRSIDNSNLIAGNGRGLLIANGAAVSNGITNAGTIIGTAAGTQPQAYGISIGANTTVSGGITNSGTISGLGGSGYGINLAGRVNGGITNSGTISGSRFGIFINGTSPGGIIVIGNDTARFDGSLYSVYANSTPMSVASGATFTINNGNKFAVSTFTNNGTLKLGAGSTGTISGNFTNNGTFSPTVGGMSSYGKLQVSGTANLGGTLVVDAANATGLTAGTLTGVITGGSTVSGTFTAVSDNSSLFNFQPICGANSFDLALVSAGPAGGVTGLVSRTGNPAAAGAAGALDQIFLDTSNPITQLFVPISTGSDQQIANAITQLLPILVGAVPQSGVSALHSMNKVIQSRVETMSGLSSGDGPADRYMWSRAFGNWANQNDLNGVSGFKSSTGGMVIGGDAPVTDKVRAGGAFTYARSDIKGNSAVAPNSVDVDTYELVGYASYNVDPHTDVNFQIDVGQNNAKSQRLISFTGATARADFSSLAMHGSVGIGLMLPVSAQTNVTPSVRLDYTQMHTDGYTETGAGPLNLKVDASTYKEFLLTADAKVAHQLDEKLKLVGNISAGYDFLNKQAQTASAFTGGGPAFVTNGLEVSPWVYRVGMGLIYDNNKGMEYTARYDAETRSSGYLNQTVSAKLRWAF